MNKEQIVQLRIKYAKPLLGFGMPPEGVSLETKLDNESLSQDQITAVLINAGKDVAKIHAHFGIGFGWIDPTRAIITRKFVGQHKSWYEFLIAFYDQQTRVLDNIFDNEKETNVFHAPMSSENRDQLKYLHSQRPLVRGLFESKRALLLNVLPQVLHGNVYIGSVFVKNDGTYAGLTDFTQMLNGDPVDDLAYLSVMPKGDELVASLQQGWKDTTGEMDIEEKMHLYRLWQSYRKIYTRYAKHRYLDEYPEPLVIAQQEINNLK